MRAEFTAASREYSRHMPNPFDEEFTAQNPIVAAAQRIRARKEIERAVDANADQPVPFEDAESAFAAFGEQLQMGTKRLNSILGERTGVKFIRLEKPPRLRLRFGEKRVSLDLDEVHQLVRVSGLDLDGEWQFDPDANVPSLINLSKISTEAGYGQALTPSSLVKLIAQDAELPRPPHLSGPGPLSF
ncbi:MAG TPA: hypothetical protein VFH72_01310 [Candidatus Baltobacteraceae bacterium]|nr:hypothetical protein [Candidatus Baltobacteraceae bacterium]